MQKITRKRGEPYDEFDMPVLHGNATTKQAFLDELIKYKLVTRKDLIQIMNGRSSSNIYSTIYNLRKDLSRVGIEIYSTYGEGFTLYEELMAPSAPEQMIISAIKLIKDAIKDGKNGLTIDELSSELGVQPWNVRNIIKKKGEGQFIKLPHPYKKPRGSRKIIYSVPEHKEWLSNSLSILL